MKIYFKNIKREPKDTLYTFLYKVLRLNGGYGISCTMYATYLDDKYKLLQCNSGRRRSFDDIVYISKTYFRVSDKAVAKVVKKILDTNQSSALVLCDNINKWVLYEGLTHSDNIKYCSRYKKSDERTNDAGVGIYSFDDIITLMGLTKEDIKI